MNILTKHLDYRFSGTNVRASHTPSRCLVHRSYKIEFLLWELPYISTHNRFLFLLNRESIGSLRFPEFKCNQHVQDRYDCHGNEEETDRRNFKGVFQGGFNSARS